MEMSKVTQIGGDHYSGDYQHWDMVIDTNMHYLLGCATKYIQRDKGNRYEDLEKAISFVNKAQYARVRGIHQDDYDNVDHWLLGYNLSKLETEVIWAIVQADLPKAEHLLNDLLEEVVQKDLKGYVNQDR
tara:strand:- start:20801 stop:21190 length:390 start_codon:yes stop_codon:yes gene_type:complete